MVKRSMFVTGKFGKEKMWTGEAICRGLNDVVLFSALSICW
jgi:hypothetical protein